MRITLMHNPTAGRGEHARQELVSALAKAGHQVTYQSTKKSSYKKALKKPADLVLVAGGDGTVSKVGRELIDTGIPMGVLPLGTANNLARSLGFIGSADQIIAGLEGGKKRSFDIGVARGPWGKRYFFESVGGGLLADYLSNAGKFKEAKNLSEEQEMARHVLLLRRLLHVYRAQKWKIELDDKDMSDRYILWESMNIRSVGPSLNLASHAATEDGRLDFVCAREEDRSRSVDYLDSRLNGREIKFPLPFRRFRKLKVTYEKSAFHFDSKRWPRKNQKIESPIEIEITVKPSALVILQPRLPERPVA